MTRTRVVVLFGGRSVEREVSRISARTICGALDPSRYEVVPLAVGEDGRFLPAADSARLLSAGPVPERFRSAEPESGAVVPLQILPGRADVVFPIIHGTTGEDGVLQGFLETLGIPYVGAGVTASAIGMDKAVFKALLRDAGIPTPRALSVSALEKAGARARLEAAGVALPVFVKPVCGGSSVGVTKVKRWEDLEGAIDLALRYDERALLEEGIDARELECAVLGDEEPRASVPGEVVPGHEFYDYDDKYRDDKAKLLIPAPVSEAVSAETRRLAVEVFRTCRVSGMARVDFFLERSTGRVLVNEINTLPGFTAISMYPKLWEASGLPLPKLLDELVRLALERRDRRARLLTKPPAELA
ncbi:MAG: D-alanine--D-alanine ligase family protein [Thermoanaerobaculia bacterium]